MDKEQLQSLRDEIAVLREELSTERSARERLEYRVAQLEKLDDTSSSSSSTSSFEIQIDNRRTNNRRHQFAEKVASPSFDLESPTPKKETPIKVIKQLKSLIPTGSPRKLRSTTATPLDKSITSLPGSPITPRTTKGEYSIGQQVQVKIISSNGETTEWEDGVVVGATDDLFYSVCFEDGEEWAGVPEADLTATAHSITRHKELKTLTKARAYFSGYVWLNEFGWLQTSVSKQWMLLIDNKVFFASSSSDVEFHRAYDLSSCSLLKGTFTNSTGIPVPANINFELVPDKPSATEKPLKITCHSLYDYNMWLARLSLAMQQAKPGSKTSQYLEQHIFLAKEMTMRPVVPCLAADKLPEEESDCRLAGYVKTFSEDGWLSKTNISVRLFATLHPGWFTIRPNTESISNIRVVPLRDTTLTRRKGNHNSPYLLDVSGPFLEKSLTISFDSAETYMKWCTLLEDGHYLSHPEVAVPSEHDTAMKSLKLGHKAGL